MKLSDSATLITIAGVIAGVFILGRCSAPAPAGLPAPVQKAVILHQVQTVVDTAAVHRLERAAARLQAREDSVKGAARLKADEAARANDRADSLLQVAAAATSAADSADAFRKAEIASRRRADSLQSALMLQEAATATADQRVDSIAQAKSIETGRANRADSTLNQVIPIAEGRDCRMLRFIRCPSRKAIGVIGILAGATAATILPKIAKGKIRLPLHLSLGE